MNSKFYISSLILLTLVLSLSFISAEEFGYNYLTQEDTLRNLNDVNITNPSGQQVIVYNQSSNKWYNSYLNDSAHHVNASDYWITGDRGSLRNVNDILHSWLDTTSLLWSNAGHIMDTFLDMNSKNIIDVGNLEVNDNISVGGKINVTGNVIIQDRLFVGLEPSQGESIINPGDMAVGGNLILAAGTIAVLPDKYGLSAGFFNNGADDANNTQFYLNFSGELNTSESLFCDFLNNPFNDSNKRDSINVLSSSEFWTDNIYLAINTFINSSCVTVATEVFGSDVVLGLTNVVYVVSPQPVFGVTDNDLVLNGIRMFYETNESLSTFGTYTRQNTLQDKPGGTLFADAFTNTDGELEYVAATQTGLNNSGSFVRNSFGVWSTRLYNIIQKENLTFLHDMVQRWITIGITPLLHYDSNLTGASLAVEFAIETQKVVIHDDIGNGQLIGEGEFTWLARDNTDMEFLDGNGILISKEVIKEFGFSIGDSIVSLSANFDSETLEPFVQTTGGGILVDWSLSLSELCHSRECASALGGTGSPLRSMQSNFSSIDQDNLNLSFWLTTVQSSPDIFTVEVNNNVGSGDITVFTSSATFTDEFQSVILPSSMDNKSIVTVIFNFQGNNPSQDAVYVDEVLVVGNATVSTLANVTVQDGSSKYGDGTCGIGLFAEDGHQDLNITCDNINLIGDVTAISITEVTLNITDSITVQNNITLGSGAVFWSNSTCAFISSPDGSNVLEVCDI